MNILNCFVEFLYILIINIADNIEKRVWIIVNKSGTKIFKVKEMEEVIEFIV